MSLGTLPALASIATIPLMPNSLIQSTAASSVSHGTDSGMVTASSFSTAPVVSVLGPPAQMSNPASILPMLPPLPASSSQSGLSLSMSSEPIPARLVTRIQSGQFIEMRDLLRDNIALTQHYE